MKTHILRELSLEVDKTYYVEEELVDKISLWMLRILFKLGGHREFIDKDGRIKEDDIARFLDIGEYIDKDEYPRSEPLNILKKRYIELEQQKDFTTSQTLANNIAQISSLMNLNTYEEQILEFKVLLNQYDVLNDAAGLLGRELNTHKVKKALNIVLDIPMQAVTDTFKPNSKFSKSSIISFWKAGTSDLNSKLDAINDEFLDNLLNLDDNIMEMIKDAVRPCDKSTLTLHDYKHLSEDIDILIPYLKNACREKEDGVNILLYGLPGTGKTELAKTIADVLGIKLFEVSYADEDDEPIDGTRRLRAYKTAQAFLANQNTILMYDEAEDVFDKNESPFSQKRQEDKAWINRILESNTIPTIWITNNIYSVDNALVRRFDMSIEIPIPSKSKRAEIIKNYSNDLLDEQAIKLLAENENIAPAVIARATKVISSIHMDESAKALTHIVNNTLKAQGYKEIMMNTSNSLHGIYDLSYINTTVDLGLLTKGIQEHQNARLCLYGPAGTGKSAFGKYIAEKLDRPLLLKKGSDLISMWVGGTEKNIAKAFEEAREENAVLIFDEVDSFLTDRTQAQRSWEVTQVNEMLVQMENFDGIFIATTNLMDNLDQASLRRFDLKLEFDFLQSEQAWNMFSSYCQTMNLQSPPVSFKKEVQGLRYLTPGDFAAVTRQNRFHSINSVKDFIERLADEIAVKNVSKSNTMGFLHHDNVS